MTEDDKNDVLRWVDDTHDEAEQTERGVEALFAGLTGEHAEDDAHTFHEAAAYTRRNVWDLSAAQYHALKAALDSLNTDSNPAWGRFWFLHRVLGDIVHQHAQRRFLPWHRLMVWKFEQLVRGTTEGRGLHIPYWTWWHEAGSPPSSPPARKGVPAFWVDYRPAIVVPRMTDPGLRTLLVALQTADVRRAMGNLSAQEMRNRIVGALTRNGTPLPGTTIAVHRTAYRTLRDGTPATSARGTVTLPTRANVRAVLRVTDFGRFSDELEDTPHGSPHVWVGNVVVTPPDTMGAMFEPEWSPCDVLFWFHHCEIDRLWRIWQRRNGNGSAWTVTGAQNPPWSESIADVLDVANGALAFDFESRSIDDPFASP